MVRPLAAALVAALCTFLLVGCGGTESRDALDPVAAEAEPHTEETLVDAIAAAIEAHPSVHIDGSAGPYALDLVARAGDADELAAAGTLAKGDRTWEGIFVDGAAYLREPGDDKYQQLPQAKVDEVLGTVGSITRDDALAQLDEAIASVEFVGPEDVAGEELDRYDLIIDGTFLTEQLTTHRPDLAGWEVGDIDMRLWLDDADLVRRAEVDTPLLPVELTFSAWGEPVEVEAPPAAQVKPFEPKDH